MTVFDLHPSTDYFFYPFHDSVLNLMRFPPGGASQTKSPTMAQLQNGDQNIALTAYVGLKVTTPAAAGSGGASIGGSKLL
jgi:hypothetical protein